MRRSLTRIRTSHVGRLPPPKGWADMPARLAGAEITDPVVIAAKVTPAIAETVKKQIEAGIDCIGDGEFWTARNLAHYAAHFTGVEARPVAPDEPPTTRHSTRERDEFPDFYGDCDRAGSLFLVPGETPMPPMTERVVARGPLKSKGPDAINRQLDTFKAAIERSGATVEEAFVPVSRDVRVATARKFRRCPEGWAEGIPVSCWRLISGPSRGSEHIPTGRPFPMTGATRDHSGRSDPNGKHDRGTLGYRSRCDRWSARRQTVLHAPAAAE